MGQEFVVISDDRTNVQQSLRKELYPRLKKVGNRVARRWNTPIRFILPKGRWGMPLSEEFSGVDVYLYAAPPRSEDVSLLPAPAATMHHSSVYGVDVPAKLYVQDRKEQSKQSNVLQCKPQGDEIAVYGKSVSNPMALVRPPGSIYVLLDLQQTFDGSDLVLEALLEESMPLAVPQATVLWSSRSSLTSGAKRREYEQLALGIARRELQHHVLNEKKAQQSLTQKQRKLNELAVEQERIIRARDILRERVAEQASEEMLGGMFDDMLSIPTVRGIRVEGNLSKPDDAAIIIETEALEYEGLPKEEGGVRKDKLDIGRLRISVKLALDWDAKHMVTMTRPQYQGTHRPGHIKFTPNENICFDGQVGNQLRELCAEGDMLSLTHLLLSFVRFESSKDVAQNESRDDATAPADPRRPGEPYYKDAQELESQRARFIRFLGKHRQEVELASIESELKRLESNTEKYVEEYERQRQALRTEESMVLGARAVLHATYGYVANDFASLSALSELDSFIRRGNDVIFRLVRTGGHAPPLMIWLNAKSKDWTLRGFRMLGSGEVCISDVDVDLPTPVRKATHRAFAQGRPAMVVRILWAAYQNNMHEAQLLAQEVENLQPENQDVQQRFALPSPSEEEE